MKTIDDVIFICFSKFLCDCHNKQSMNSAIDRCYKNGTNKGAVI